MRLLINNNDDKDPVTQLKRLMLGNIVMCVYVISNTRRNKRTYIGIVLNN